jgi:hypothetical protein
VLKARKEQREAKNGGEPRGVGRPKFRPDEPEKLKRGRPKKIQADKNLQGGS